ncbi:hypothetical protein GH714_004246 [Hevea brasiliensis]|uniref:Uncharacterized protein n=1 Tax=Hevea brasiliensis TaxID=3981 RepID=A0A6A6KXF7_HEVBR|nr:hypothetical protein GH714_004246 [Hevea brasiliensis]
MEIATTVGGAILSPVFKTLIDKLASQDLLKYARGKVLTELKKWKEILEEICVVLDHAEEQQMTNQLVKIWAEKLRDLAYDVEDILNEFDFEAQRRKLEAGARKLSYDGCLSILAQHALGATNFDEHLDLKAIGEKIARRCQGLPLAAQAIGGVLRDYQFDENELVLQWMAEGFLQQQQELKQMEALGHEYFQDLLLRSFFQPSTSNKSQYVMHDLINDLAQSVSGEVCFNLDDKSKSINSYSKVRHSAFICYPYDISQRFEVFKEMNSLRTFLPLPKHWGNCLASNVVHESVPTLKRLRVLSLSGYQFEELQVQSTLKLRGCYNLTELHAGIGNLINLMHIDLIGTDSLVKMPREMANLTNLQTLSKFIVGKGNGLGIKELMKFPNLGGQLQIEGLHNVVNIQDAELADLKKDEGLDELALVWSDNFQNSRSDEDELLLLSFLQPHQKLRKLSVEFYGGKKFPSWIGDPSFTNMVDVELCSCPNIISLPPLGLLSKLRNLRIEGMGGVAEVSVEFYGHNSSSLQPFPSLETLEIQNMLELKHWACSDGRNEEAAGNFPKLHELTIINCPKLDGKLPRCLPSLKKLNIEKCQEMILRSVPDLTSLTTLKIKSISGLAKLDKVVTQALVALEDLVICGCSQLMYLWQDSTNLDKLACLHNLEISFCWKLMSLVAGEEGLLPCNLEVLSVEGCYELENLTNRLHSLASLRILSITHCPKLVHFPATGLPCSLKGLHIQYCDSLESMPESIMQVSNTSNERTHLKDLRVIGCSSLTSLPVDEFPHSVKRIQFCCWTTQLLESLDDRFSHLTKLVIRNSPKLESFPESGLAIPNLSRFTIEDCANLKSLPNQMQNLKSLVSLAIRNCGDLVSFPEGGLPPNLIYLSIFYCKNLTQPMSEWRLQRLASLQNLEIRGTSPSTEMVSFPDEECQLLPSSLTFLAVGEFENLKSISRGLHNLTSLDQLRIYCCPKLRSLPKEGLPSTL